MSPTDRQVLRATTTVRGVVTIDNTTTGQAASVQTTDALEARLDAVQMLIAASGDLEVTVSAGKLLFADGQTLTVPAATVEVFDERTNYIGVRMQYGTVHALRKRGDCGTVWIGEVICAAGSITSIVQYPAPIYPPGRVERFKRAMQHASNGLKVVTIGNSLWDGSYGASWTAFGAVFDSAETPTTYQIPNCSAINWKQYQYGGQKSSDGLMWLSGRGVTTQVLQNAHSASVVFGPDYLQRNTVSGGYHLEAPGGMGADLVVIGDELNGGRDNLSFLESMVREARSRGSEVILLTDNDKEDGSGTIWSNYATMAAICDAYGAALCDTASYLDEIEQQGTDAHIDNNHPNATGVASHAKTIRNLLSDYPLRPSANSEQPKTRIAAWDTAADYASLYFGRRADFVCVPSSTTGTFVATDILSNSTYYTKIPSVVLGQKTVGDCTLELDAGEYAFYSHPFASRIDVIWETSNPSWTTYQQTPAGVTLKTHAPSADSAAVKLQEATTASEIDNYTDPTGSETTASPLRNVTVKFTGATGTTKLLGVVFWTVPYDEIPESNRRYGGLWSVETQNSGAIPAAPYTDTVGSTVEFEFVGTAACVVLAAHNAAGKVDAWVDDVQVHSAHDLYTSQSGVYSRSLMLFPARAKWTTGDPSVGYGRHTARIKYASTNGSAGSVSAGSKRRVQILGTFQLDTR